MGWVYDYYYYMMVRDGVGNLKILVFCYRYETMATVIDRRGMQHGGLCRQGNRE